MIKTVLKDAVMSFIFICSFIVVKFIGPAILALAPLVLAATFINWLWLLLYIPFGFIACVIASYITIKGEHHND